MIDFEITHKKSSISYSMPEAHEHTYYEVGYMISGEKRLFVDHTNYNMTAGDLILIPKEAIHRAMGKDHLGSNQIILYFAPYYLEPLIKRYGKDKIEELTKVQQFHFNLNERKELERFLHQMIHDYRRQDCYIAHEQQLFIEALFIILMRHYEVGEYAMHTPEDEMHARMSDAAAYMSKHYEEDMTLNDVATRYDLSCSHFTRQFKAVTGFGFKEYLIALRIRAAARLLINTNLSVTEIALKCGFNDSNYFGDAFKRVKGVSPRDYRKVSGFI